ncbi:MAG TPA: c-type cytochrome [Anaerolineales bacterium]|nr:c-type cytochrome [Anaerolineales bacterium]
MLREWLARLILVILLLATGLSLAAAWKARRAANVLYARMPENGGWTPSDLRATVGEPLTIRMTSDDVTHSFAVGQMDWPAVDIYPGEMSAVTLTFDRPGKYTFYCTRWCGVNHWRMRGTIQVSATEPEAPEKAEPPLYVQLGLDIDAEHSARFLPDRTPSAGRGAIMGASLPQKYASREYYLSHSPSEAWQDLRDESNLSMRSDAELWDLVAFAWSLQTTSDAIAAGEELYRPNCAACHGKTGGGNGVFAKELGDEAHSLDGHAIAAPAIFSDPENMLGASPALLHGKIVRGGMGTGMPYWGPIFTDEQVWALVSYLWTFQFNFDLEAKP